MMMFPLCFYSALPLKFTLPLKTVQLIAKTRYRGLTKKTHRLLVTCAMAICSSRVGIYCAAKGRKVSTIRPVNPGDAPIRPQPAPITPYCVQCQIAMRPVLAPAPYSDFP